MPAYGARPLGTIWEVPDELWERFEPILLQRACALLWYRRLHRLEER